MTNVELMAKVFNTLEEHSFTTLKLSNLSVTMAETLEKIDISLLEQLTLIDSLKSRILKLEAEKKND